jgi:transcription elongation factor GreB
MSKAFTRESDDLPERAQLPRQPSPLPPGAKNYLTPEGEKMLREELDLLIQVERPRLAASAEEVDAKRQVRALDQRIAHLQQSLHSAVVVPPPPGLDDRVRFGAIVTVRGESSGETRYRIVGVDETDIDQGRVSWLSPIAKTLLNVRVGQHVRFKFPSGEEELEIVRISYQR